MSTFNYQGDVLVEHWDDEASPRQYTRRNAQGEIVEQRAYTQIENAKANAEAAQVSADINEATIKAALAAALVSLQTIIDTPNNQINAAAAIKDLARVMKRSIRMDLRQFDGTT